MNFETIPKSSNTICIYLLKNHKFSFNHTLHKLGQKLPKLIYGLFSPEITCPVPLFTLTLPRSPLFSTHIYINPKIPILAILPNPPSNSPNQSLSLLGHQDFESFSQRFNLFSQWAREEL